MKTKTKTKTQNILSICKKYLQWLKTIFTNILSVKVIGLIYHFPTVY